MSCNMCSSKYVNYLIYDIFFFFKQKTAYEMRISDWSSDVCSSDLLLRNPQNLKTPEQQVRLEDLLAANQALMTVYLMKAELKTLWTPSTAWGWRSAWKQWLRHAHESEIPALIQFAKRLKGYWRAIVRRVRWPMPTGRSGAWRVGAEGVITCRHLGQPQH